MAERSFVSSALNLLNEKGLSLKILESKYSSNGSLNAGLSVCSADYYFLTNTLSVPLYDCVGVS